MPKDQYKPTLKMAEAAKRGLELRARFGRGGTDVGVARAHQLAERRMLDFADVKSIYSYFRRHEVDKQTKSHVWGSETDPSAGYIAWLLWGGDDGQRWSELKRGKSD
jgi:hypothetical protein